MNAGAPDTFADDGGRYRLDSRIATGGMGEVWRATDTSLDREVAIKLLKSEYADDAGFRARFESEARHAGSLHHPGIASVYDFGEAASRDGSGTPRPFLVMELVDGRPLSDLLRPARPLEPQATRELLAQTADALAVAHAAGIVHRDVKPANLLVTPDRQVKITDFGIARATEGLGMTQTGQVMGTPQYLSPEQARGGTATPASDVYALGVVAYECLAGHRPFQAESPVATALAHLHDPVPPLPADVPRDLARVVLTALEKDPADRFASAADFAAALRDPSSFAGPDTVDDATQVVAPPPAERTQVVTGVAGAPAGVVPAPVPVDTPEPEDERPGGGRRALLVVLLVALVAAVAVVAFLALRGGDDDEPDRPAPTTSAGTVRIDEASFRNRPVDEVRDELVELGLKVSTTEVPNDGGGNPGLVTSVDPTGVLQEGDTVEVSYWGEAPEAEPTTQEPEEPTTEPTQEESPTEPEPETETPTPEPTVAPTPTPPPTSAPTAPSTAPPTAPATTPATTPRASAPAETAPGTTPEEGSTS